MIRLRIKNFGPIGLGLLENDGWIDFKRVTLFIGNQGAGKSTLAKTWLAGLCGRRFENRIERPV